jgi:hypothetical protein
MEFLMGSGEKAAGKKMIRKMYSVLILFVSLAAVFVSGCTSLVNAAGETLDSGAFSSKPLAVYLSEAKRKERTIELREETNKADGAAGVLITSSDLPGFALRGSMPDSQGRFELTSVDFLSSHYSGWNEFSLDLLGRAEFAAGDNGGVLRITENAERVQITKGRIRLKSSRITGSEALSNLRNRRERILALTDWMRGQDGVPLFTNQKEFGEFWKPRLLPEMVSKKTRPPEWQKENAEWAKADSVKWNQTYTALLFPEELRVIRDSGALLRDWEESLPWIYLEYNWDFILASFDEAYLVRKK